MFKTVALYKKHIVGEPNEAAKNTGMGPTDVTAAGLLTHNDP